MRTQKQMNRDAIMAALINLACNMEDGTITPDDGDIGAILTCDGTHAGLGPQALRNLADDINNDCEEI